MTEEALDANYKRAFGKRIGFGARPALILIDFVEAYFDPACPLYAGVEDALFHFGMTFCQHMMNDDVICSMRSVIGVIDRMPGLARRFFSSESVNVRSVLRDYLEMQRMQGKLAIDDTDLAARQLIDMCSGSYFKLRLFGEMKKPPPREELDRVIGSAVRVFMAAYRRAA